VRSACHYSSSAGHESKGNCHRKRAKFYRPSTDPDEPHISLAIRDNGLDHRRPIGAAGSSGSPLSDLEGNHLRNDLAVETWQRREPL
jgi:hypothetical protein